ncbi:hypothetical protein A3A70_00170 [candidate division WWE3 bacterium RIFCSPLOWO2_01_FULL_42_11]|uniref:Endolytic murein transglycosylase n=1 Tax=candidate division WWE3 bacterium RIFCSPLOWO2_01_FULL_42_11 TaxID=1802627 RepID=A0A1F4VPF5_UNCKA|nr:MAG: hypothetical protein A3A70_00170 [candidate division WWE3 bacterium RIFCSPLOWO2_01_FULL_42_11]
MLKRVYTILIFSVAILSIGYIVYSLSSTFSKPGEKVALTIEKGEGVTEIAKDLKNQGVIKSPFAFKVWVKLSGAKSSLQAGDYELNRGMTIPTIVGVLKHGTFDKRLTIVEGLRTEEIAHYLSEQGMPFSEADFISVAKSQEGYLFPDTYVLPKYSTAQNIADVMASQFNQKVTPQLREDMASRGLTLDQTIILASLVEHEAISPTDKAIVAGILLKRLKNDWPLQSDVTLQYAIGFTTEIDDTTGESKSTWWKTELTAKDLALDSPYNTRLRTGLPPTPICNPGLDSIKSVIYSQESDYWYYISDKKGEMHYAITLDEHNANIDQYLTP